MTISDLIIEGETIKQRCQQQFGTGYYISCPEYATWLTKTTIFMENNFGNHADIKRLRSLAERANGNGREFFDPIIGILEAFKELPPTAANTPQKDILLRCLKSFDKFAIQIKRRHQGRSSVIIQDEYDVQDLIHAILKLFISDIRPEEWTPKYAGGASRMDFFLPDEETVIETKMTRDTLKDKGVGEELIIDIARYKQRTDCNHLVCLIYDKDSYINNPTGLKKDLENLSDDQIIVTVIICPE